MEYVQLRDRAVVQILLISQEVVDYGAPIDQPFSWESSASPNLAGDRAAHPVYNYSRSRQLWRHTIRCCL